MRRFFIKLLDLQYRHAWKEILNYPLFFVKKNKLSCSTLEMIKH